MNRAQHLGARTCASISSYQRPTFAEFGFERSLKSAKRGGEYFAREFSSHKAPTSRVVGTMCPQGRIHILGIGNLGRLFAHALAIQPNPPPITLLLHRANLLEEWEKAGRRIEITTDGIPNSAGKFDVEVVDGSGKRGDIHNLVVTTKTINTVKAMDSVKHRLASDSTILFAQNGMGTIDEVTDAVFKDPSARPQYLAAVTSHGVYSQGPFRSVHAGLANVTIGRINSNTSSQDSLKSQYLLNQIINASILSGAEVTPQELTNLRLEKLVVNAMMNPLTAIFHCRNGELFTRGPIVRVMRLLLQEASHVVQLLPELRSSSDLERFSTQSLEEVVLSVAEKTAKNTSSMLQDVQAGRETEIDYINGWIVRKGTEMGVDCRNNETLVKMVKEGKRIGIEEIGDHFPPDGCQ